MSTHSKIPPSSAAIWGAPDGCTGWVSMSGAYPEMGENPAAAEGTAAHEVAAQLVKWQTTATTPLEMVDTTATNGVVIDAEMFEAAQLYADDIGAVMRELGNFMPHIEERIEAKASVHPESFGTPDCWLFDRNTGALYIWDFKYGHETVDAFENWQGINYAAGIIEAFRADGVDDQFITVRIRIVQPRAFHRDGPIREWAIDGGELRAHINILSTNAHEALGPNPVTRSGAHCRHCSARHACPVALQAGLRLYELAGQPIPVELPLDALGVQLAIVKRAIKALAFIESGIEEQAKGLITSGSNVPGWILEQGYGREKWKAPAAEVIALGDLMGIDIRKPLEAITPKQAVKLGIDASVIKAYSETPKSSLKLVSDNGNKAKQVFKP
jgi:hypothetical protein